MSGAITDLRAYLNGGISVEEYVLRRILRLKGMA